MTITNERIKAIFLAHGFKEKPQEDGSTDLNPYVYQAARALLAEAKTLVIPTGGTIHIQVPAVPESDIIEAQRYLIEQATKSRIAAQEALQHERSDWQLRGARLEREAYQRGRRDSAQVPAEWREAVQEFVDRCERGEVRSVRTYAKFKALLETALLQWPEDSDEYGRLAAIAQNGNDGLHYQDKALSKPIPTADQIRLVDAAIQPPPSGAAKLILLSRYGVTTIGTYQKGYHVAWAPMPKAPDSVKRQAEKEVAA